MACTYPVPSQPVLTLTPHICLLLSLTPSPAMTPWLAPSSDIHPTPCSIPWLCHLLSPSVLLFRHNLVCEQPLGPTLQLGQSHLLLLTSFYSDTSASESAVNGRATYPVPVASPVSSLGQIEASPSYAWSSVPPSMRN